MPEADRPGEGQEAIGHGGESTPDELFEAEDGHGVNP